MSKLKKTLIAIMATLMTITYQLPTFAVIANSNEDKSDNSASNSNIISSENSELEIVTAKEVESTKVQKSGAQSDYITAKVPAEIEAKLKAEKIGIGGGGALFEPAISPHDSNEMLVVPDMGGIYISHDKGLNWSRANLYGTVISATYDPNRKGVVYAGGSGLWRSTDDGRTFKLLFPNENEVIARLTHNENALQYYFTESGLYDRGKYVKNILIDPEDSTHIFVLCYSYGNGKIFESKDDGETFNLLFEYAKNTYKSSLQFEFNELIYRRETKDIFAIHDEGIVKFNLQTEVKTKIYETETELVDVSTVYENGKTYFVIIEKTNNSEDTDTIVYYTNDFENKVDITDELISVQPTYFDRDKYGHVTYKYSFRYISATSLNNIYITNWSYASSSSIKDYPYTIDGIIRYHDGEAKYLYGNPFYDHNHLASRAWNDGCTYALGISASMKNEDEFIFTTLIGIYYSENNTDIYPRQTTVVTGKYPNAEFVTNGIDEQATYGVAIDPFHEGVMLLLNTDLGLIRSENNGKSWKWTLTGIPSNWQNTIYDAIYDERRENIVYSLWSGRHNAPYSAKNETDNRFGGFAISTDAGKTWDATYSSGLPTNAIPVKMSVIYQENSEEVTIYVATFNCGFYVSYNSGRTFTEMNNGLERISYKEEETYQYIFAEDIEVKNGHIFGLTAKTTYNGGTQPGELFEYVNGKWNKIQLPKNVITPRDIYYYEDTLYITGTATALWDKKNGVAFNNYAGGIYAYKDGEFTQIFDESISTTSVVFDSKGTLYVSDTDGNIFRKEKDDTDYTKIYDSYHYRSESLQISDDDDCLYLASFGGGLLRIENLNSLYEKEEQGEEDKEVILLLGDIDNDGEVTINDLALLKLHLINKRLLTEERELNVADIDRDEELTINDLAKMKLALIGKIELGTIVVSGKIEVEDTYFSEYEFKQITPVDGPVTFERVIMQSKEQVEYGSSGAGSQWPTQMECSRDGNLMLMGTDVAGMAKSTDHGKNWRPCNVGFETRGVGMFAIDPFNNNHVLTLGISKWINNGGIYVSYDECETWNKSSFKFASLGIRYLWDGLEFDPTSYNSTTGYTTDVYFSTPYMRDTDLRENSYKEPKAFGQEKEVVGLYKSVDGGQSFNIIINDERVADGIVKITDNGKIYVGSQHGLYLINKTTNKIEKSYLERAEGENFTRGITGLDVVGNTIYAQTWAGIFKIEDGGEPVKITDDSTYTTENWPQLLEVSASNPDHMIYMYRDRIDSPYTIETKMSEDGGKTWINSKYIIKSSFFNLDGRGREKLFIIDPSDDRNIITYGGFNLERSSDGGLTFTQVAGLSNSMQGGKFNFNYYNPDLMLFSAQDYTGEVTFDGGKFYKPLKIEGKGNIYGGFAADEETFFGFANETWWGGTLTVTHDGGRSWEDFGLEATGVPGTVYYSCMQSYTDPNVLFAAQYYSKDKGYHWQEMNGCVAVFTINYTGEHEIYGGDIDGNLVVSYDNGDTWKKLNSEPFAKRNNVTDIDILDIAYDHVHNYAYVVVNEVTTPDSRRQYVFRYDITNDTATEIIYPKDTSRGWGWTKTIAIDPNCVDVLYIGQAGDYYCAATGLVRSIDGGKTWKVLTNANDSHFESIATNQGGYEIANIRVNPIDGKVWIAEGCYGYETIEPPYDSSLLEHKEYIEHTIKYVYDGKVVHTEKIRNGKTHNFVYNVEGLEFVDWYTDRECTNSFSNGSTVLNSMVLYAKMNPSTKLELYINDTLFTPNGITDLDKYDTGSEEFIPKKEGYAFAGWFYDKELTEIVDIDEIKKDLQNENNNTKIGSSGENSNNGHNVLSDRKNLDETVIKLYAGWYKVTEQIFNPENNDMAVYIAYADHKIQANKMVDNSDFYTNRSILLNVEKNSSYLVTFKMDTRFRIGLAKSQFWSYGEVKEYYINENDNNSTNAINKYVYKVVDTTVEKNSYQQMLIFYYTHTGTRDFMDIKNTFKVYKLESKELVYEVI